MYDSDTRREILIGLAVVVAVGVGLFLTYGNPKIGGFSGYEICARFNRADGVSVGTDVRMAGIKIGSVSRLDLDPATYAAIVDINIDSNVKIPTDSTLVVISSIISGNPFLTVEPGKARTFLRPGGLIVKTIGATDSMSLIIQQGLKPP